MGFFYSFLALFLTLNADAATFGSCNSGATDTGRICPTLNRADCLKNADCTWPLQDFEISCSSSGCGNYGCSACLEKTVESDCNSEPGCSWNSSKKECNGCPSGGPMVTLVSESGDDSFVKVSNSSIASTKTISVFNETGDVPRKLKIAVSTSQSDAWNGKIDSDGETTAANVYVDMSSKTVQADTKPLTVYADIADKLIVSSAGRTGLSGVNASVLCAMNILSGKYEDKAPGIMAWFTSAANPDKARCTPAAVSKLVSLYLPSGVCKKKTDASVVTSAETISECLPDCSIGTSSPSCSAITGCSWSVDDGVCSNSWQWTHRTIANSGGYGVCDDDSERYKFSAGETPHVSISRIKPYAKCQVGYWSSVCSADFTVADVNVEHQVFKKGGSFDDWDAWLLNRYNSGTVWMKGSYTSKQLIGNRILSDYGFGSASTNSGSGADALSVSTGGWAYGSAAGVKVKSFANLSLYSLSEPLSLSCPALADVPLSGALSPLDGYIGAHNTLYPVTETNASGNHSTDPVVSDSDSAAFSEMAWVMKNAASGNNAGGRVYSTQGECDDGYRSNDNWWWARMNSTVDAAGGLVINGLACEDFDRAPSADFGGVGDRTNPTNTNNIYTNGDATVVSRNPYRPKRAGTSLDYQYKVNMVKQVFDHKYATTPGAMSACSGSNLSSESNLPAFDPYNILSYQYLRMDIDPSRKSCAKSLVRSTDGSSPECSLSSCEISYGVSSECSALNGLTKVEHAESYEIFSIEGVCNRTPGCGYEASTLTCKSVSCVPNGGSASNDYFSVDETIKASCSYGTCNNGCLPVVESDRAFCVNLDKAACVSNMTAPGYGGKCVWAEGVFAATTTNNINKSLDTISPTVGEDGTKAAKLTVFIYDYSSSLISGSDGAPGQPGLNDIEQGAHTQTISCIKKNDYESSFLTQGSQSSKSDESGSTPSAAFTNNLFTPFEVASTPSGTSTSVSSRDVTVFRKVFTPTRHYLMTNF